LKDHLKLEIVKNKDSKIDNKALKKEFKKNIKVIKKEKKKAIKKVKEEKDKAIEAIKKFAVGFNSEQKEETKVKDEIKTKVNSPEISKEELEKSFDNLPATSPADFQSVDLKANEAIERLSILESKEDINFFLNKEKRSTILKAAEKRKTELEQSRKET
jgi:hypothetical protein